MRNNKLDKLEEVKQRAIWPNEEVLEKKESAVGKYSADIYGKDVKNTMKVLMGLWRVWSKWWKLFKRI